MDRKSGMPAQGAGRERDVGKRFRYETTRSRGQAEYCSMGDRNVAHSSALKRRNPQPAPVRVPLPVFSAEPKFRGSTTDHP